MQGNSPWNPSPSGGGGGQWDYSSDLHHSKAEHFKAAQRPFYVCAGTQSWNRFLPDMRQSSANIIRYAAKGKDTGACGFLVTDWGDWGHICPLGLSFPGFAIAAQAAWNNPAAPADPAAWDEPISRIILQDASGQLVALLREAATLTKAAWTDLVMAVAPRSVDFKPDWFEAQSGLPHNLFRHAPETYSQAADALRRLQALAAPVLAELPPSQTLLAAEIHLSFKAAIFLEETAALLLEPPSFPTRAERCASLRLQGRATLGFFDAIWRQRNKPSEFFRIREVFNLLLEKLN